MTLVVVLSFVGFVDWTDFFILEGGIGIFHIFLRSVFVPKNFGFSDCMFVAICGFSVHWHLVFGFRQKYSSNGLWIWSLMWFSDFPTWILVSLRPKRSLCASSDLEKPRNPLCASLVNTVSDRLRFWELGYEDLYVLTVLHTVFGFWSNCCCCCCCCFFFFAVLRMNIFFLRFLTDPLTDSCFAN